MTHELICLPAGSVENSEPVLCRKKAVSNEELARRLDELERSYDEQLEIVFEAIAQLMKTRVPRRKPIGFRAKIRKKRKTQERSG